MKRHVEITERFIQLVALAHSRPADGREVGVSEQIAALELIAAFGRRDRLFTAAASSLLSAIAWTGEGTSLDLIHAGAQRALERLPKRYR